MSQLRVYYLDDEPALCELFTEYFEGSDIAVTTFVQAGDAIAAVEADLPDIMFIDYRLSDTNGEEVAGQLPDELKKVLITGDLAATPDYPFDEIIEKPFSFVRVEQLILSLGGR